MQGRPVSVPGDRDEVANDRGLMPSGRETMALILEHEVFALIVGISTALVRAMGRRRDEIFSGNTLRERRGTVLNLSNGRNLCRITPAVGGCE